MPKQRITTRQITDEAIALVDADGFEALTLSNVAAGLSVGPSALYTHLDGLDGLRYLVAVAATDNLADAVRTAAIGTAGGEALSAMGLAYRNFANEHPGQFASTLRPPPSDTDDLDRANQSLVDVFALVYGAMGLTPDASNLAARSTRSAIHGFLALEHISGTGPAHAAEYEHLLSTLQRGLTDEA
jgi:AcrR family transcriptional regulator